MITIHIKIDFKKDEEFDTKLYEETKEYFGITENDTEKKRI